MCHDIFSDTICDCLLVEYMIWYSLGGNQHDFFVGGGRFATISTNSFTDKEQGLQHISVSCCKHKETNSQKTWPWEVIESGVGPVRLKDKDEQPFVWTQGCSNHTVHWVPAVPQRELIYLQRSNVTHLFHRQYRNGQLERVTIVLVNQLRVAMVRHYGNQYDQCHTLRKR